MIRHTAAIAAFGALAAATAASAQDAAARIAALEARVAELERTGPRADLTFGSDIATTIEIYGYVKADFIVDFGAELGDTTFGLAAITSDDGDAFFNATVRQTRIGLRTTTPTAFGDLGTQVEIDFFDGDQITPRIRHANATLGGWRVGQYWTLFMPISSYPTTLDFQGVAGIPFARQEQLRYTHDLSEALSVAVSLEESNNGDSDDPVAVAALSYETDPLLLRVSAIYGTAADGSGATDDAFGVNLSTTAQLWSGARLDAGYTWGEGIASYMVFGGADLDAAGNAAELQSAYAGLSQTVGDRLTLRAIYGWRENDTGAPDAFETLQSLHLNAQYKIVENVTAGIEYFHGIREEFDGDAFDVDRIQAAVQIDF